MSATTQRARIDLAIPEKVFQQHIVDLAKLNGFLVHHPYDSRRSEPGLPDLILVRPATNKYVGQLLMWEVKSEGGIVTAAQIRWMDALADAGVEVRVVRPRDWEWIVTRLRRRHTLPVDPAPAA